MRRLRTSLMLLGLALVAVSGAQATLLEGETVEVSYHFPEITSVYPPGPQVVVVGPGVEITNFPQDNVFDLDLSDTNLYFDYIRTTSWNTAPFNGVQIRDILGLIPDFTSVVINPATNLVGFSAANITFDGDNIFINWQGLSFTSETVVSLDLVGSVPEPSTGLLVLLGVSLFAGLRGRNRR